MASSTVLSRVRRALPLVGLCAAALLVASCGTDATGLDSPGFARLNVQPQFLTGQFAPVTLDRVEAIVERFTVDSFREGSTSDTLLRTSRAFGPTSDELQLALRVPLKSSSEVVRVTLSYFAGPTLLFVGSDDIEVSVGGSVNPEPFSMDYVGPGANAAGLIIEPFDTTVTAGSTTPFRATAIDGQENDVGAFYMRWSVSSTANGASIDAAGRFHAPSQPGTLWVRGNLPNGVDDSVQVTVTGTPGAITIVSGNHQTGQTGTGLELPLVVRVTSSGGAPIQGVTVNWAATIGGGALEVNTTTTDANGESENLASLGPNPGVNAFTATVAGVGSVTFLANETQTGATITWVGNTSAAWSNGANWSGGVVPSVLDSVVINSGTFSPVLDTTPLIGALTLGGDRSLTLASHGLVVVRNLTLLGNSVLEMTTPNDFITVGGNAHFEGGNSQGHLTDGILSVAGNFTQRSTNSSASFSASGNHIVSLAGQNPVVSFASPGAAASASGFQDFAYAGTAGGMLTLASNMVVRGLMISAFNGATTITSSAGHNLRAATMSTSNQVPLIFNNVTLTLQDTVSVENFLGLITFQNMPTNRPQMEVRYPGGFMTMNGFTFSTTPVAPNGFYLEAEDTQAGADSLTINVTATPTSPGAFLKTVGGTVVNWPANASF
ncbi:MAG TPA: Ig-like domain-containing protein [Gemmatimonadales bacterium]|nr:Ig-like domain-containing protein [Gemmatimonadales bacterium]